MTTNRMRQPIAHPPLVKRPWGLLVDAAYDLALDGDRWRAGVTFPSLGCDSLSRITPEFCVPEVDNPYEAPVVGDGLVSFNPFHIVATEECSTLDVDLAWLDDRLAARWVGVSGQVAAEISQGGGADDVSVGVPNPTFENSATVITTGPLEAAELFALVEQELDEVLHGAQGMIHLTPAVLSMLDDKVILRDGQVWRTYSGHLVVADGGYAGAVPDGEAAEASTEWIFASGMVGLQVGAPRVVSQAAEAMDGFAGGRNRLTARRIAEAVAVFEPCAVLAAQFGYPSYSAGS